MGEEGRKKTVQQHKFCHVEARSEKGKLHGKRLIQVDLVEHTKTHQVEGLHGAIRNSTK